MFYRWFFLFTYILTYNFGNLPPYFYPISYPDKKRNCPVTSRANLCQFYVATALDTTPHQTGDDMDKIPGDIFKLSASTN